MNNDATHVCTVCHSQITPKKKNKSSFLAEVIVWLVCLVFLPFSAGISLVPAVFFSLWRMVSKTITCPECGSLNFVPLHSPAAKKILTDDKTDTELQV